MPSECQTVWTLIRPDDSSGLIWVQTVCQDYQQTSLVDKELKVHLFSFTSFQVYFIAMKFLRKKK